MRQTIGQFLATMRKSKGYTQQEVADRLGVSNRTLSAWETDKVYPDILALPALAELYGVTADEILKGERNPPTNMPEQTQTNLSEKAYKSMLKSRLAQHEKLCVLSAYIGYGSVVLLCLGALVFLFLNVAGIILITFGVIAYVVAIAIPSISCKTAKSSTAFIDDFISANQKAIYVMELNNNRALSLIGRSALICSLINIIPLAAIMIIQNFIYLFIGVASFMIIMALCLFIVSITKNYSIAKKYGAKQDKDFTLYNLVFVVITAAISAVIITVGTVFTVLCATRYYDISALTPFFITVGVFLAGIIAALIIYHFKRKKIEIKF